MRGMPLAGLGPLVRLALRRQRWFYLAWVVPLALTVVGTASAYEKVVDPTNAQVLITTMENNPTMRAMLGPPFDLWTAGGFTAWRVGTFAAAMVGMMAVLGVVRCTRADEETGRTELVRAGAVGRHTPLLAGVVVALAACALVGVLTSTGMVALGEPVAGSVAMGAGLALVGAAFVGVGAVVAQVTSSARGARSLGLWTLAGAYTLRAVADGASADSAVRPWAWLSPVQWMALTRPYAHERWWVLLLPLALAVVLVGAAFALEARRDHGSGLRAARRGRTAATPWLGSVEGLASRLHRGGVLGWAIGMALFAVAIGSLSTSVGRMLQDTPGLEAIFRRMGGDAGEVVDTFFIAMLGIVTVLMGALAVMIFHRLRAEEESGHAELLLSTGTSRLRLLGSHVLPAAVVPTALLVMTGGLLAVNQARATGDSSWVTQTMGAAAVLAPGGLLVLGLAVLVHGWAPRFSWLTWVVIGWSLLVVWVGNLLGLPWWLVRLTPWAPLPTIPADAMDWPVVLGMTLLAVVLTTAGAVGYLRRDLR